MIIAVAVKLKQILEKGRNYAWPKPDICPACRASCLWGHGFVAACFDGFATCLMLRRYRCPACHCVIRMKPQGYFARFQASIETIRASVSQRVITGKYLACISRSRQQHWLRALKRNVLAYLGDPWRHRLAAAFERLIEIGTIPVSRSI
jgi:hypothetical protein